MNRGVEIASDIADGPQSVIEQQVEMGVAVRMAVMETLMLQERGAGPMTARILKNVRIVDPVAWHGRNRRYRRH
jgi:hypothetical protein